MISDIIKIPMMMEFLGGLFKLLGEWGLVSEDSLPLLVLLVLFYFALHVFQFRKIFTTHRAIMTEVEDVHNASMEMQRCLHRNIKDYDPIHSLEKLRWSTANSPLDLNEKGEKLLRASGMESLVEDNINDLMELLKKTSPQTRYDVAKNAFDTLIGFIDERPELLNQLKEFVFENPVFEGNQLGLGDLAYVGSLVLRDSYIEKHKELLKKEDKQ